MSRITNTFCEPNSSAQAHAQTKFDKKGKSTRTTRLWLVDHSLEVSSVMPATVTVTITDVLTTYLLSLT